MLAISDRLRRPDPCHPVFGTGFVHRILRCRASSALVRGWRTLLWSALQQWWESVIPQWRQGRWEPELARARARAPPSPSAESFFGIIVRKSRPYLGPGPRPRAPGPWPRAPSPGPRAPGPGPWARRRAPGPGPRARTPRPSEAKKKHPKQPKFKKNATKKTFFAIESVRLRSFEKVPR